MIFPAPLLRTPSRGLLFQQVDGLNGFRVADVARRRVVETVEHTHGLGWFLLPVERLGRLGSEGLVVPGREP